MINYNNLKEQQKDLGELIEKGFKALKSDDVFIKSGAIGAITITSYQYRSLESLEELLSQLISMFEPTQED